jgi:hypothetical protein
MKLLLLICLVSGLLLGCVSEKRTKTARGSYPYLYPLSSPGTKFGGLPPAVQHTIRAQTGAADMYDILKLTEADETVYAVVFSDEKLFPPLYVKSDGSVLYPDLVVAVGAPGTEFGAMSGGAISGVKLSDLPINVVNTIQQKAPTAEVAFINRVKMDDKVFYEVSFKDGKANPKMLVAEDGTFVRRMGASQSRSP